MCFCLMPRSYLPAKWILSKSLEALCQIKIFFPTWGQISYSDGKIYLIWSFKLFSWNIIVLEFQSHVAGSCNSIPFPSSLLLLESCKNKQTKMCSYIKPEWKIELFFILHVWGRRLKGEQFFPSCNRSEMCAYVRLMDRKCIIWWRWRLER